MPKTTVQKTSFIVMTLLAAATFLLLLPVTDNFILNTKMFSLFFGGFALLALYIWKSYQQRSITLVVAPFTLSLFLFGLATLASIFFTNAYPYENLLGFGGIYIAMVVIALVLGSLLSKTQAHQGITLLGILAAILSFSSILQAVGFGPSLLFNNLFSLNLPDNLIFNLSGSSLIAAQIGLLALTAMISSVVIKKSLPKHFAVLIPVVLIGLVVHVWSILPGKPAQLVLPPFTASWSVALDTIRSPRAALIGVGPSSYTNSYNQFKPAFVNGTDIWNIQFGQATNVPLTLLTTNGFLGLVTWLIFMIIIARQVNKSTVEGKPLAITLLVLFGINLVLPGNVVLFAIQALLLGLYTAAEKHRFSSLELRPLSIKMTKKHADLSELEYAKQPSSTPAMIGAVASTLVLLCLVYFTGRAYAAHVYLNEATKAAQRDDGRAVYELQQKAVELNPYLDSFRREYAVTNILIAAALSNKTDASEAEKEQIAQLLQQAIREARSATLLDPNDTQNWYVLAQIYQNMMGVTEEAEQWAIQSYVRAIETNPTDPAMRINLGGIFISNEQYQQAAELFAQAAQLKADYPNAYYNLAVALQNLQRYDEAKSAYQQVLTLLEPNSDNYIQVTSELEKLEELIEENKAASPSADTQTNNTSIIEQNLEDEASVVNEPSTNDLDLEDVELSNPTPTPSPAN